LLKQVALNADGRCIAQLLEGAALLAGRYRLLST
jgi:5-hydroxyisourate hydrolase-like protein (transthyretin family)